MTKHDYTITAQSDSDNDAVEHLLDEAFGIARRTKPSYRLREGEKPADGLSFVARNSSGEVIGAVSFWHVHTGRDGGRALLLGPLAVLPQYQARGLGQALMAHGLAAARKKGARLVILVGDADYYARAGFRKVPAGQLLMPGAPDPDRLLYLELEPGAIDTARGNLLSPSRYAELSRES